MELFTPGYFVCCFFLIRQLSNCEKGRCKTYKWTDINPIPQITSGGGLGRIAGETGQVEMYLVVENICKFYFSQNVKTIFTEECVMGYIIDITALTLYATATPQMFSLRLTIDRSVTDEFTMLNDENTMY